MVISEIALNSLSDECKALIRYAKSCSWQGTGQYFAECLENNYFIDTEKVFVAYKDDHIIGFIALIKESCVESTTLSPWLDFLFVDEEYRNQGVAKMLIKHLLAVAKKEKIVDVYLCTVSHETFYSKLGFHTLYEVTINKEDNCCVMQISI